MPPRYAYWTIVLDTDVLTSFRSATRNELVTTLHQIRRKDPKAELRWFAGGRLWESPTEAQAARVRHSTKVGQVARTPKATREVTKRRGGPSRPETTKTSRSESFHSSRSRKGGGSVTPPRKRKSPTNRKHSRNR